MNINQAVSFLAVQSGFPTYKNRDRGKERERESYDNQAKLEFIKRGLTNK